MSQLLSQIPRQLLQQQQRLTPQLIQAMDILQLNAMALESRIEQEIDSNPALELETGDDEQAAPVETETAEADRPDGEQALVVNEHDGADDFQRLDNLSHEYELFEDDEYSGTRSRARLAEEGDAKLEAMANTEARPGGLRDYLLEQWAFADTDDTLRPVGAAIIDNIDDSGRLAIDLEQVAAALEPRPTHEQLLAALTLVQELDPPGVAARSLQECLLLQLNGHAGDTSIERRILEQYFDDLQRNRLPQIARSLGVEIERVKEAMRIIGRLSLHPGLDVVDRVAPPITPDVIVEYNEETDEYDVRLTRVNQRELRISAEFREALEKTRDNKDAREFIREKIEAANAIIDAIRYRKQRLLEVARAVVAAQRDFLDRGEQHMRVLRMSDLAERFGCDPSTISRTVDGKWMETPRGVYPLRRFFTGGTESHDGEVLGWDSIKAKVQEIVDQEDKRNPLSDDLIVEKLQSQGIDIKRRTVAKYRAQLSIPTARQRRQY